MKTRRELTEEEVDRICTRHDCGGGCTLQNDDGDCLMASVLSAFTDEWLDTPVHVPEV